MIIKLIVYLETYRDADRIYAGLIRRKKHIQNMNLPPPRIHKINNIKQIPLAIIIIFLLISGLSYEPIPCNQQRREV